MKKALTLFLALAMLLGVAACGSTPGTEPGGNSPEPAEPAASEPAEAPAAEETPTAEETPAIAEPEEPPAEPEETPAEPEEPPAEPAELEEEYVGEDSRPRIIVTTDLECDDMNSLIHMALFFDELDVDGIVYSASQYHFIGDGEHTLGEINPNYCCLDENAADLTSYRPMEIGWIEDLWSNEYAEVYPFLAENDPRYPAPEDLLEVTKVGNVEFEGDVRFATEGSDLIKAAMLDGDMRPLYVMSWGGFNTVARALLSIAEEYQETELWDEVYDRVVRKTVISGYTQDFAYRDHVHDLYPDLVLMGTTNSYAAYFAAQNAQPDVLDMFQSDWMSENIKFNHGALMGKYGLFGDGTYYEGETPENQFGEVLVIDWGWGFAYYYDQYDFLGEGDSDGYIALLDFGLRGLTEPAATTASGKVSYTTDGDTRSFSEMIFNPRPVELVDYNPVTGAATNDSGRYIKAYQEEFAARADWCVSAYADCNHAPVVAVEDLYLEAAPGNFVALNASVEDPDGDTYTSYWWVDEQNAAYSGSAKALQVWDPVALSTCFTVPADAAPGDQFCLTLQVRDQADAPMTRYAQVIVTVVAEEDGEAADAAGIDVAAPDAPHDHTYRLQPDSYEATDTEGGYRHFACTICGDDYSYETDPLVYPVNPRTGAPVTLDYAVNPYLPTYELMPDNELHVFWSRDDGEWRVYAVGSHDSSMTYSWCGEDVVCWSAPVYDLTDWRYEGVLRDGGWYFACDFNYDILTDQVILFAFPFFGNQDTTRLWVNGNSVPDSYFGTPLAADGIPGLDDSMKFDPAIYTDAQGNIYVMFDETTDGVKHGQIAKINDDRTAVEWSVPVRMEDGNYNPNNYEANTLDYIEEYGVYVVQYSYIDESQMNYYPLAYVYTADTDLEHAVWKWGGILSDNGGFYQKDLATGAVEYTGEASYSWDNNHGGLVKINGEWYVSNHRHTAVHAARQGYLQKVEMSYEDGELRIIPTEYTSSIGDSIDAFHPWQAAIACYITPAKSYSEQTEDGERLVPNTRIETLKGDENNGGFVYDDPEYALHRTPIIGIEDGATVGFKYLDFGDAETDATLSLLVSQEEDYVDGTVDIYIDAPSEEKDGVKIGSMEIRAGDIAAAGVSATGSDGVEWSFLTAKMDLPLCGVHGVYLVFHAGEEGTICKLDEFSFTK